MSDESDQSDLLFNVTGGSFELPNDHVRLQHEVQCPSCDVVHPLSGGCVRWHLVAVLRGRGRDCNGWERYTWLTRRLAWRRNTFFGIMRRPCVTHKSRDTWAVATLISLEPGFAPEAFCEYYEDARMVMQIFTWCLILSGEADPEPPGQVVSFEMKTAEQKFLAEAQQFLDLSPLDRCQHQVWAYIQSLSTTTSFCAFPSCTFYSLAHKLLWRLVVWEFDGA